MTAKKDQLLKRFEGQFVVVDGIFKGSCDVFLSHNFLKANRSVFSSRDNEVFHWCKI